MLGAYTGWLYYGDSFNLVGKSSLMGRMSNIFMFRILKGTVESISCIWLNTECFTLTTKNHSRQFFQWPICEIGYIFKKYT